MSIALLILVVSDMQYNVGTVWQKTSSNLPCGGGPICGGGACKVPGGGGNGPGGGSAKSGGGTFKCGGRGTDMGTEMMLVTGAIGCGGGLQRN